MQPDLFESATLPRARKRDPETSKDAAVKAATFQACHEAKVYAVICEAGERGATYKEIATSSGMEPVAVGRRLGAMGERDLIRRRLKDDAISDTDYQRRQGCAIWWKK